MYYLKLAGSIVFMLLLGFRINAQVVSFDQVVTTFASGFNTPSDVTCDASGNIYVADYNNHKIYKVTPAGVVRTLAGSTSGYLDGIGTAAQFKNPGGLVVDASGNIYIADTGNNRIRKINSAGLVTTLAGSTQGFQNATGTSAKFHSPSAITRDASGNLYVTDYGNKRIRKVTLAGVVTTFAGSGTQGYNNGTGTSAQFYSLNAISTVDASGSFYVGDGNRIRKITSGAIVTNMAGSNDGTYGYVNGTGTKVRFYGPNGNMPLDASGNLYISDYSNGRVRKMTSSGVVSNLAGNGVRGNVNGTLADAQFDSPSGAAIDASGNIYVSDFAYGIVKKIAAPTTLTAFSTTYGTPSVAQSVNVSATGLTGDFKVTAPTGYEVSTNETSGYSPNYSFANNGTVSSITIYVRLSASATVGTKNGNLTIGSTGATNKTLSLKGTVSKSDQTITFSDLATKTYGDEPFTLSGTSSSGLALTYTSSNTDVATIVGNTVTIVGAGITLITASQTENADYYAALSVHRVLNVNRASQTTDLSSVTDKVFGDAPFDLPATTSAGFPITYTSSNTAVATIVGNTLTIVGAGLTSVFAKQAGNSNYDAVSSERFLRVNSARQIITFAELTKKTYGDAPFDLTATASSGLAVTYQSSSSSVAIVGNTVTILRAGTVTITADQAGDNNYAFATPVRQTLVVNKANQTITFAELDTTTYGDAPFILSGTSSSGLGLAYKSSNAAVATFVGNRVTIVGAGFADITVSQSGNDNYNAATPVTRTLTVNKTKQTITLEPIADQPIGTLPFTLNATSSSGLPVSFLVASGPATISGNEITLDGSPGLVEIKAKQAGNANYEAAEVVSGHFNVFLITGTSATVEQKIIFYPNPVRGATTVYMPSVKETYQLVIYNSIGDLVYETLTTGESESIDFTNMSSGVYYVTLFSNKKNERYSGKLLVIE